MKQGALVFDKQASRYDIRFDLTNYYGGVHCGQTFGCPPVWKRLRIGIW